MQNGTQEVILKEVIRMAKCGGKADIVELFRRTHRDDGHRFLSVSTISTGTNISPERINRILGRATNVSLFRRSTGSRPNIWTLIELDR